MAARLYLLEVIAAEERRERTAQRRQVREFSLQQPLPDKEFINTFRLTPGLLELLCMELTPLLQPKVNSRKIDPKTKILIALKLYGRGDYQGGVGRDDAVPVAQQTVSDCVREVTDAMNLPEFVRRHIHFPQNRVERGTIKRGFYNKYGFPGACGAIDCTHVAIHRPVVHEERFFNRKHFHSLNVQMICDESNKILNVDASYGGATHDSFIWEASEIKTHLEALCGTGEIAVLLGDSGYALREYLMTPVDGADEDSPEGQYNTLQKRARSTIERTFGVLKGRWRCLLAARELYYTPEMAGKIVIACSALHNMCMEAHLEPIDLDPNDIALEYDLQRAARVNVRAISNTEALRRGREARAQLIRNLFM